MKRPFALIGFSFLLTLAAAVYFGSAISLILCNVALITFGILLFFRKRFDIRLISVVLLTAALAFGSFSVYAAGRVESVSVLDGEKVVVSGRLCELPYEQYNRHYYTLAVDSVTPESDGDDGYLPKPDKIRISTQNPLQLDLYDRLTGAVQLYTPSGEDGFSSRSYYAAKGITMFGFLYEYEPYTVEQTEGKPLHYYLLWLRQGVLSSIHSMLPEEEAGLLSAAILGERYTLDKEIQDNFADSGISHILVVSGLHMSLISMLLLRFFRMLRLRRTAIFLTAAGVLSFMAITGFSPSVLRSGIMMLIMLGGMLLHRQADAVNSLGLSVFLICLWNPYAAADLGLLLSFSSTLGILVLTPKIKALLLEKRRNPKTKCPKILSYCIDSLSVTFGVTVFTLPVFLMAGRSLSLISPLSNLLLLLPATIMIETGFLAAVLHPLQVALFLSEPLALVSGLMGKLLIWVTSWLAKIPFATVATSYGFVLLWLLFSLLLLSYLLVFSHKRSSYLIGAVLSSMLLFVGIFSYQLTRIDTVRVAVLDVGEGTSVVISKGGSAAILGCEGYNENVLHNYLQTEGVHKITYLQLTSGDHQEKKNGASVINAYETEHLMLERDFFVSGSLEKSLANVAEVSYYQDSAEVSLLDTVRIRLDGPYGKNGIWFSVEDVTFLLVGEGYQPDRQSEDKNTTDFLIADGLPEKTLGGAFMTTILSLDTDDVQVIAGKSYLDFETANLYVTGGKGNLLIDVAAGRTVAVRRGD